MSAERSFVVGVDVGGTKTHACVATAAGEVLGFGVGGAGNWEIVGCEATADVVAAAVGTALSSAGVDPAEIKSAVLAMAGCDWQSDEVRLRPVGDALGLRCRPNIVNDAFGALRAGSRSEHGIVNNAGTGGVTAGRARDGRVFRTMAVGIGEGNGSSDLRNRAMSTIAKEHHGQIPPTRLTTGILEVTGFASVPALFEAVTRGHRVNLVDVVPVVLDAADDGDDAAVALVQQVASTHARDVLGVARVLGMLDESCDVVLAGSVHARRCRPWSEAFTSTLTEAMPGAVPRLLEGPPVTGAVLLAIEALGNDANEVAVKVRDGATTMLAAQVAVP